MSRTIKRHLKVGDVPEFDEDFLIVRMHSEDMPKGIKWNNYIHLSTNNAKIACKVRTSDMAEISHPRIHKISINRKLRETLGIKSGLTYDFYIQKALFLKAPYFIIKYHPDRAAKRRTIIKLAVASVLVIAAIIGLSLYFA